MTEVPWITFWQGFRGIRRWLTGRLTAETALLPSPVRRRIAVVLASAPAFHDPTAPPMNHQAAVGRAAQDRPRHGCRGRAYKDVLAACPAQPGPSPQCHIRGGAAPFTTNRNRQPCKKEERRTPKDPAPGGAGGGERTRRPRSCGGTPCNELSTSGSASSRSRSGAPARPAAARSPAAWPAHRHSCRPSGRTPAWPWRPPRSSAACAPG